MTRPERRRARRSARCTPTRRSSSRTRGTQARPGCWPRWGSGAGHHQLGIRVHARTPDGGVTLDEAIEHAAAIDARRPSGLGRPRERLRRRPGGRRARDQPGGGGRRGGRVDRGLRPGRPPLRAGPRGRAGRAAVEAARSLAVPFMLTARAENHIRGNPTSATRSPACRRTRRQAPTCSTRRACGRGEIRAVCDAVTKPVNVLALPSLSLIEIVDAGATARQRRWRADVGRDRRDGDRRHRDTSTPVTSRRWRRTTRSIGGSPKEYRGPSPLGTGVVRLRRWSSGSLVPGGCR